MAPRLSRAPSQLARRIESHVTAPPLRLSGDSPDSLSDDAKEPQVWSEAADAAQVCEQAQAIASLAASLTLMPVPAVG